MMIRVQRVKKLERSPWPTPHRSRIQSLLNVTSKENNGQSTLEEKPDAKQAKREQNRNSSIISSAAMKKDDAKDSKQNWPAQTLQTVLSKAPEPAKSASSRISKYFSLGAKLILLATHSTILARRRERFSASSYHHISATR